VKKASKDGGEGTTIVRGTFRFWGGEVDVATVVGDKNVLVSARNRLKCRRGGERQPRTSERTNR
jgi:hypothetical protein